MPAPPRTSVSGVSADNIIEGSRKRAKLDIDSNSAAVNSPASSTSRLPDASSSNSGPGAEEATVLGFKLLDVLINRIDEDDTPLTVPFLALPLRSDYPDYYDLIKNPVSLEQVRRRLQSRSFESFEQVRNNLETICRNAKRYNLKGSEIYEKARTMHQIILHAYVDLVEKGDVQPLNDIVLRSDPPLQQQSEHLALVERPGRRARLDFDELDDEIVAGRVSLRLKKDDDILYDEDKEVDGTAEPESDASPEDVKAPTIEEKVAKAADAVTAKVERNTPQMEAPVMTYKPVEKEMHPSQMSMSFDGDDSMIDTSQLDRSMLTLAGKFDRRKRPGPRGKRLKSTLRNLVAELKLVMNRSGQPITRFFLSLPSRLQYPDYYKVIQRPIALDSIEDKVARKDYVNPHALVTDLRQMVENAQYYNEEGSEVWEAAEEIRQYVEGTTIPTLLADGFTLDPNDLRQSALPVEIAANSSVPAQAAAFRIQVERRKALENGTSTEMLDSVSPELGAQTAFPLPNEHSFKIRLGSRATASASPAILGEMQPPGPAPPSATLGLSSSDPRFANHQSRMASHSAYGRTMPNSAATPTSYLNSNLPSSGVNGSPWQGNTANGIASPAAHANGAYFAATPPNIPNQPLLQSRSSMNASSMAPPTATYSNGSLPFQKPTRVQLQGGSPADLSIPAANGSATPRTSTHLSKRLQGEGPAFDQFKTNGLQLDLETTIVRNAVISQFNVRVQSKDSIRKDLVYRLVNDVTRIHSINLTSGPPDQWQCTVELTPRDVVPREASEETRQWTLSIHHNGKGIKPQGNMSEGKESNGTSDVPTSSSRVQVEAGSSCQFSFSPIPGANIISVHVHPPPPNSALQEIVKDEKHPLRSKAKALLDLPERYRILVYCRG